MIVMTVDQRGSTYAADRVPEILAELARLTRGHEGLVVPFERTVGDEVQGILAAGGAGAQLAVDLALYLLRGQGWSIGIGVGEVDVPLPAVSREARGFAFYRARDAVERAKTRSKGMSVAVEGPPPDAPDRIAQDRIAPDRPAAEDAAQPDLVAEAEALLRLLAAIRARRTPQGWEVADTLASLQDKPGRQRIVARSLNVSEQAVSQRVRAALWHEEEAVRPIVVRLLAELSSSVIVEPDAVTGPVAEPGKRKKMKRAKS
ncbi:hypothetical protein APR04_000751 [Promicromonospora umidemergens]|uniref:SatD family protein n=1 Tax=Promicromonospora umidemergens TaxID=629679 RepID=A0ABP8XNS4_9MICO|nr:hypothetical protein [Promicromonospora umidemergens]MCP2281856.1 hypothetical protein [Promicromonospora umidemergens]